MPRRLSRFRRLTLETLCDRRVLENHAPVLNPLSPPTLNPVTEGAANPPGTPVSAFANSRITDQDAGALKGIAVVGLTENSAGLGIWQYSLNGGSNWTALGDASDSAALVLAPNDLVRYVAPANYAGNPKLTFRAWDQTDGHAAGDTADIIDQQGGAAAYSTAFMHAVAIITPVNDAPVVDTSAHPQLGPMNEGYFNYSGVNDFAGPTITDADGNAKKGIAVVGLTEVAPEKGHWQYWLKATQTFYDFPNVSDTAAVVLDSMDTVRYLGAPFYLGAPQLRYRAWDATDGATPGAMVDTMGHQGGTGAYSLGLVTATQLINDIDGPPVVTVGDPMVYRLGSGSDPIVPNAVIYDADSPNFDGGQLVVQLSQGTNTYLSIGSPFGRVYKSRTEVEWTYDLLLNSVVIGTLHEPEDWQEPIHVDFNTNATVDVVQQLVRSIEYERAADEGDPGPRTANFTLYSSSSSDSRRNFEQSIKILLANAPPELSLGLGQPVQLVGPSPTARIAPNAGLADPTSPDFDDGSLVIGLTSGAHPNDRLEISGGNFTIDSANHVLRLGIDIGVLTSDGHGGNPLQVDFNASATPPFAQELIRQIVLRPAAGVVGRRTASIYVVDGDGATSNTRTATIDVVSATPVLTMSGTVRYERNKPPVAIAPNATVTDADNANFAGGLLTVQAAPGDTNTILAIGGPFNVDSSNNVRLSGVVIGVRSSNGVGGNALHVALNSSATLAITQQLVRAITYQNLGGSFGLRTITFTLNDGQQQTGVDTKLVNVVSAPPVLALSGSLAYHRNAPAVILAPDATVTDLDSPNFGGGSLRVRITSGGGTNNTLASGGGFTVDGSGNVKQGTLIIGKRLSNGVGTNELKIQFNSHATRSIVQALVRSITYRNVGGSAGARTIAFTVSDGDGGVSATRTKTVNVT